ncbi:MAG: FAD-dependent oxidoreductase [Deltaproteobacteria bacterium]|nr:FAD-dependent oxidoreductase [Deltaproteobacteria bacterium]
MKYPNLFTPIRIRNCQLTNRIMSTAAVTRLASEDGHVTPQVTARYQRMAAGGLGAMVVEAAVVLPSRSSFNFRVSDDRLVDELKSFVASIREVNPDIKIGLQIMHFLKLSRSGWRQKVQDLTPEEIAGIPQQFAGGAWRAKNADFDFVEIHMAHFTTLASFLSLGNKRPDDYGGDFEGRIRLPSDVVLAVREAVADYPVGIRINGEEFTLEGNTLSQSTRVALRLANEGVDYISVSAGERFEDAPPPPEGFPPFAGTGYSGHRMSPRWWHPDGPQVYLAEGIRRTLRQAGYGIPVVTAGKIRRPDLAESILNQERADIIGMARTLLCDPDWPVKARENREDTIVMCAACGFCSEADERYEPVTCIQWPEGLLNAPSPWLLVPPCQDACPAHVDIRGYMDCIVQGHYEQALDLIHNKVPLPMVIGRVCPRFCEKACNRNHFDGAPVAINVLKRFVADGRRDRSEPPAEKVRPAKPQRVAVAGAGPAGLSAAFYLSRLGYGVTVFEAGEVPGGMLAWGIPAYRLPREILRREIAYLQHYGFEIKLNQPIGGAGLSINDLFNQGYNAVFLAMGAQESIPLEIEGADMAGIVDGLSWLKDINLGKSALVEDPIAVIGGGNTAIDAARSALRLGVKSVTVLYRRSREDMPAIAEEVAEAEREGVKFICRAIPKRFISKNGKIMGIECLKAEPGAPDKSGRPQPVTLSGSEFFVQAGMAIVAVGQRPDLSPLASDFQVLPSDQPLAVNSQTLATEIEGVFAGGDLVRGPASVIEALADGRRAAFAIHSHLSEEPPPAPGAGEAPTIGWESIDMNHFKKRRRVSPRTLPVSKRLVGFPEVEASLGEREALMEADRCLQCGLFPRKEGSSKSSCNQGGQNDG